MIPKVTRRGAANAHSKLASTHARLACSTQPTVLWIFWDVYAKRLHEQGLIAQLVRAYGQ